MYVEKIRLLAASGGECRAETDAKEFIIGRTSASSAPDLGVTDPLVSRKHARIFRSGGRYWIENLGRNGTKVNGLEVDSQALDAEDLIEIGSEEWVVETVVASIDATVIMENPGRAAAEVGIEDTASIPVPRNGKSRVSVSRKLRRILKFARPVSLRGEKKKIAAVAGAVGVCVITLAIGRGAGAGVSIAESEESVVAPVVSTSQEAQESGTAGSTGPERRAMPGNPPSDVLADVTRLVRSGDDYLAESRLVLGNLHRAVLKWREARDLLGRYEGGPAIHPGLPEKIETAEESIDNAFEVHWKIARDYFREAKETGDMALLGQCLQQLRIIVRVIPDRGDPRHVRARNVAEDVSASLYAAAGK